MSGVIVGPIVLLDGHDVAVYQDVDGLEGDLEVWEVLEGSLEAFDLAGHRIELCPNGWGVRVCGRAEAAGSVTELTDRVRVFVRHLGESGWPLANVDTAGLEELVHHILNSFRRRPEKRRRCRK